MWLAASSCDVPEGVLATLANPQLNPKPHQGLSSKNPASHPALDDVKSTVALGLRAGLHLNRLRQSERARYYGSALGRFTSPDPIGIMRQKLLDPQQWNMYVYARNNPLRFMDPTGMYVASCGSDVKNCDKQIKNLDKAIQNALKSKNSDIAKAAGAYGKLGDKNGVNVSIVNIVDPKHSDVTGITTAQAGTGGAVFDPATGKAQQATQVNIRAGMDSSTLQETAVHEGVHVEDRENFVNSITERGYGDNSLNIIGRQSERNAYGVENEWLQLQGKPTRDINDILAHPPYSDNPGIDKPLFPDFVIPQ